VGADPPDHGKITRAPERGQLGSGHWRQSWACFDRGCCAPGCCSRLLLPEMSCSRDSHGGPDAQYFWPRFAEIEALESTVQTARRSGGIGRRSGFQIRRPQGRTGSSPVFATELRRPLQGHRWRPRLLGQRWRSPSHRPLARCLACARVSWPRGGRRRCQGPLINGERRT